MIKRLSKLLNVDFLYLLRGGSVLGVGHTIGVFSGFFLSLIFANYVDGNTYGTFKYIVSIAGILGAFTLSGVTTTIMQSVARGFEGTLRAEQKSYLKWSSASILFSVLVGTYYVYKGDPILGYGIIAVTICNYILTFFTLQGAFLSAKKNFRWLTINQTINSVSLLGAISAWVYFGLTSVPWIIFGYYGSQIFAQCLLYLRLLRVYKPNPLVDSTDKNLSKHLSAGNIITSFAEYLDKILIFQYLGPYQLALYAFSVGIPDQIRGVNKLMNTLIIPKMSLKDDTSLDMSVKSHAKKYVFVSSMIVIVFYFIAPYPYHYFFSNYPEAAGLASLYLLILPITALSIMHGHAIQIKKDVQSLYIIRTVEAGGKIILLFILIPLFGVPGAICSILFSKTIATLLQITLYKKTRKIYG